MFTSARPDIHNPIAGPNGVFVVLDNEHGVAQVAQSVQRVDQAMIIALVQPDGRLVQHIQRAHESRANLAGQTNALGLTTGQGASRAREGQIVETDIEQKPKACVYFFGDALGNHLFALTQLEACQKLRRLGNRQFTHLRDGFVVDFYRQRFGFESRTLAGRAWLFAHVTFVLLSLRIAFGALMTALQPRNHTFKLGAVLAHSSVAIAIFNDDIFAQAMHDDFLMFGSELGPWLFGVNSLVFGHGFEHPHEVHGVRAAPRGERTFSNTQIWVRHHQVGVNFVGCAETEAFLARAIRRVEGEIARGQLFVRRGALRAYQLLAEVQHFADSIGFAHNFDGGDAIGQAQSRFHAVGQAPVNAVLAHQAVHNHIDGVLFIARQFLACFLKLRDFHYGPVDTSPSKPLAQQIN